MKINKTINVLKCKNPKNILKKKQNKAFLLEIKHEIEKIYKNNHINKL